LTHCLFDDWLLTYCTDLFSSKKPWAAFYVSVSVQRVRSLGAVRKPPSWMSLLVFKYSKIFMCSSTLHASLVHDKSVGYFIFAWFKRKDNEITFWLLWTEGKFPFVRSWVASIPSGFGSCVPALKFYMFLLSCVLTKEKKKKKKLICVCVSG